MTMRAVWKGQVLAESDQTVVVESNHYFPPEAVRREFFAPSNTTTVCSWKGLANYYTVNVEGAANPDAAWYYSAPKEEAEQIRDYVAFWRGVTIESVGDES